MPRSSGVWNWSMSRKWSGGAARLRAGRRPGWRPRGWRDWPRPLLRGPFARHLAEDADRFVDLGFAGDERRQDAQHVVARGQHEKTLRARLGDDVAGGDHAFDAEQHAGATHAVEHLGM